MKSVEEFFSFVFQKELLKNIKTRRFWEKPPVIFFKKQCNLFLSVESFFGEN